jgi:ribulose 1,5-bisphosphate synthetase/thiazole synthase
MQSNEEHFVPDEIRRAWRALKPAEQVDVLVIGGGPAGCAAAIAAVREGPRTLLVEQFGFLGGMGTAGLVPAFCPFTDQQKVITRGIALDILEEMKAAMPHVAKDAYDWVPIAPEALKVIYERRVTEAGARLLFLTRFVDVVPGAQGGVASIVLHNKSGLRRVEADVVLDCTGDADVAVAAGAPYEKGAAGTGELQPCTMCFILAGVDNQRLQKWLWADNAKNLLLKPAIAAAKAAGDLNILEEAGNVAYQSESTIGVNFSHVFDVDGTNAEQLAQAHIKGRQLIRHLTDFFRKYCPGCENAYLVSSGVQIGVRETRRIVGEYVLTLEDYVARRSFPDEIARNAYYIDVHGSKEEREREADQPIDWKARSQRYRAGESHGIPYRCLIPKNLKNVLVAGRCISTDRALQGSIRTMPNCLAMGEAAGCAAAMAAKRHGGAVRELNMGALRQRLRGWGAYLPTAP